MKVVPVNSEKETIREMLAKIVIDNDYKRIFSLIGTDAGMEKYLPKYVEVVSAETQKEVFIMQCFLYRQYKLYNSKASYALYVEKPFDFIWLDFFGSAFEGDNWASTIIACDRLTENGLLAITSGSRTLGGRYDYKAKFKLLGLNVLNIIPYINNGMRMTVYILNK